MSFALPDGLELPCDIAPYVPHSRGMCLLDRLLEVDEERLLAEVTPRRDNLFAADEGIPGWIGIEWLAQAIAAWAGVQAVSHGDAPRIGFLLGTRRYHTQLVLFPFGEPIGVEVSLDFRADNGLAAFRGRLLNNQGQPLATATLNVFQPESQQALEAIQQGATS